MNEKYTYRSFLKSLWILLLVIFGISTIVCLVLGFYLISIDYTDAVTFLLAKLHAEEYRTQFETRYFTEPIFGLLKIGCIVAAILSGVLLALCLRFQSHLEAAFDRIIRSVSRLFFSLFFPGTTSTSFEKILFLCVAAYILVIRIILSNSLPFHIDEMHSWLYFVDKGPLVSLSYYPSPNNHVLFSLLCCVTDIFTNEPILIMRITSITIGMMCSLLVFRFLFQYADFSIALLGMLLFSFAPVIQHYSVLARGYMLETFFFIIAFWSFLKLLKQVNSLTFQALFVLSSVLGAFTLITFAYAIVGFGIIGLILFIRNRNAFVWIKINTAIAVLLVVVYAPLLLFSGPSSITGNTWIVRPEWGAYLVSLPEIYKTHADYFTSIPTWDVFLFPALTFFPVWYLRNSIHRNAAFLSAGLLFISFSICVAQRIVPYERMWTHFLFCQQAMFAFCIAEFQRQTQWKLFWLFSKSLIVLVAFSYPLTMLYPDKKVPNIYNDAEKVSTEIMMTKPRSIYCQEYVYFNYLSVYTRQYRTGVLVENEGISKSPDFMIIEHGKSWPAYADSLNYQMWRNCDPFVCIYRFKR